MSTTGTETASPQFVKLPLRTAYGVVYRDVSTAAPREASADEIPIIDVSGIYGDLDARKTLSLKVKHAAENTGFFYIKNHGIPQAAIDGALHAAKAFFKQPQEKKEIVAQSLGKWFNGYSASRTAAASPTEGCEFTLCVPESRLIDLQWIIENHLRGGTSHNMIQTQRIPMRFPLK